jgi:hypothetical protein
MLGDLIIFTLGYFVGGATALTVIVFTLASRDGPADQHRPTMTNHR